jgi:hypothetical protein
MRDDRRGEVDNPVIDSEAARRFDLAQGIEGWDANAGAACDRGLLFVGRVQQIDPDDLFWQLLGAAVAKPILGVSKDADQSVLSPTGVVRAQVKRFRFRVNSDAIED